MKRPRLPLTQTVLKLTSVVCSLDEIAMQVLDEEEIDVFLQVLRPMRSFGDSEEVQLQGCAALQLLLQRGDHTHTKSEST